MADVTICHWNKNKKGTFKEGCIPWNKGTPRTEVVKEKIRDAKRNNPKPSPMKGKNHTEEAKNKIGLSNMGKSHPHTIESRMKISMAHKGSKSRFWKGGITPINRALRLTLEYRLWRESVFKRDEFTCVLCGKKGGRLNADHIKSFSDYPELRLVADNGRTLCEECHRKTDNYGFKMMWRKS